MRTRARSTVAGLLAAALSAVVLLVPASPAAAHNSLTSATPAEGARLTTPPKQITLDFVEKLNPAFTTIALSDTAQQEVATGETVVTDARGTVAIDQALGNGTYTVAYRVVSVDGHPVQGSYRFTVADPAAGTGAPATTAPADVPSAGPTGPTAAAPGSDDGPGSLVLVGGGIVLALIIAAGAVALTRRRSNRAS
ncbi:copper resistance CopC family protein [Micromonospora okii]|uniref:copper resistance CopC family protein n=1 Tax=Micromonospora okii TaxID=1182970 RepID=UPI001E427859|nr:copper resistance protein CopC [Micromonospora okii]